MKFKFITIIPARDVSICPLPFERYQQEDVYHLCVEQISAFASK